VGPLAFSFANVDVAAAPPPMTLVRTNVPDVTPDGYRGSASQDTPSLVSGADNTGGARVARRLMEYGVDAALDRYGDQAIFVALGTSYVALSIATFGAAAEAGVFVGAGARVASFGARSWRTLTGVAGAIGEGARRYGNQVAQWGAQVGRGAGAGTQSGGTAGPTESGSITILHSSDVLFSQSSLSGARPIVDSMATYGWKGGPIDVVQMGGRLVTIDNTRLWAAHLTNTPVQAIIRSANESLPASMAGRFVSRTGVEATTWGEAVVIRIANQNAVYRSLFPGGSWAIGVSP
jgi:hypothetical protein